MKKRGDYDCYEDCIHARCDPYDYPCKKCEDTDHEIPGNIRSFFKLRIESEQEEKGRGKP